MPLNCLIGIQKRSKMKNNKQANTPQEVIIVEGRDDTKRLIEAFGKTVQTIETNGSAINQATLEEIRAAHEKLGAIVFTDPDFQGERIRRIIEQAIPSVKHAYIKPEEANAGKRGKSLGVEHATRESIIKALEAVMTPNSVEPVFIHKAELMRLKLIGHPEAKVRREYISNHYRLGHINGKQLQKKLAKYQITLEELTNQLKAGEQNGNI